MEEELLKFHEDNDVTYEIRALVNGEEVIKYSDYLSFDGLRGYAEQADEAMDAYIISGLYEAAQAAGEAEAESQFEEERAR